MTVCALERRSAEGREVLERTTQKLETQLNPAFLRQLLHSLPLYAKHKYSGMFSRHINYFSLLAAAAAVCRLLESGLADKVGELYFIKIRIMSGCDH